MTRTFHVVVILKGERKEFDLDPFSHSDNGTGIWEALEGETEIDWENDHPAIVEVDGIKFDPDGPNYFSACQMCDGCDDGPGDPEDWGDRSQHINPTLFEKFNNIWKEYYAQDK